MSFCWHSWSPWTDVPQRWETYPPKEQWRRCDRCQRMKVKKTRWFDDR